MTNLSKRIKILVDRFSGGVVTKFAEKLGTNEANIRNYIGGSFPKYDFIYLVATTFEISCDWLILGRGEMFRSDNLQQVPELTTNLEDCLGKRKELELIIENDKKLLAEKDKQLDEKQKRIEDKDRFIKLLVEKGNIWEE